MSMGCVGVAIGCFVSFCRLLCGVMPFERSVRRCSRHGPFPNSVWRANRPWPSQNSISKIKPFFCKKNGVEDVAVTVLVWQPRSSPYGAMPPRLQAVVGPDSQFGPGRGPSDGAAGVTGDDQAGQPLGAAACARIEIGRHSDALKPF